MQDQAQTPVQHYYQPTQEINIAEAELRMLKEEFAKSMQQKEDEITRKQREIEDLRSGTEILYEQIDTIEKSQEKVQREAVQSTRELSEQNELLMSELEKAREALDKERKGRLDQEAHISELQNQVITEQRRSRGLQEDVSFKQSRIDALEKESEKLAADLRDANIQR
jgi:soluble cytochrome b562